jgi:hypothetical protein
VLGNVVVVEPKSLVDRTGERVPIGQAKCHTGARCVRLYEMGVKQASDE